MLFNTYKFVKLISTHFLKRISWENLMKDQSFSLLGDHFINSHNLISWQYMDIVRRKLMLITFLCVKMWIIVSHFFKIHYWNELLWISCIFHFIPLLLFSFKPLICNTVDFFIRHKYPGKHRTNNFVVILTLTCQISCTFG